MYDHRVLGAEGEQNARKEIDEVQRIHAEHLAPREGGVRQRSEYVENRANAELAPDRRHRAHGRMQLRREEKRNSGPAENVAHARGVEIDVHAEGCEDVRAAAR